MTRPTDATNEHPKYQVLRDAVMDIIEELPTGVAIPSERELSVRLGSSRMTLRRALDELVRDGYLIRRQGARTYTARPKNVQRLRVISFTEDMARRGMTSSSRTFSSTIGLRGALGGAPPCLARRSRPDRGSTAACRRRANGHRMARRAGGVGAGPGRSRARQQPFYSAPWRSGTASRSRAAPRPWNRPSPMRTTLGARRPAPQPRAVRGADDLDCGAPGHRVRPLDLPRATVTGSRSSSSRPRRGSAREHAARRRRWSGWHPGASARRRWPVLSYGEAGGVRHLGAEGGPASTATSSRRPCAPHCRRARAADRGRRRLRLDQRNSPAR